MGAYAQGIRAYVGALCPRHRSLRPGIGAYALGIGALLGVYARGIGAYTLAIGASALPLCFGDRGLCIGPYPQGIGTLFVVLEYVSHNHIQVPRAR